MTKMSPKNVRAVSISSNKIICRFDHCYLACTCDTPKWNFVVVFVIVTFGFNVFVGNVIILRSEELATNDEDLGSFGRKLNFDQLFLIGVINNAKDSPTDRSWICVSFWTVFPEHLERFLFGSENLRKDGLNPCP